jgi:lactoylglutathione lyase
MPRGSSVRTKGDASSRLNPERPTRSKKEVRHMYISVVTLYVEDVDRAIEFYTKKLGWTKTMDETMGEGMRWVTVAPPGEKTALTLAKVGPQSDGKPGFSRVILEVDDVHKSHEQLKKSGVEFSEDPRTEPWGGWAMFKDSEGNEFGLHSAVTATVSAN